MEGKQFETQTGGITVVSLSRTLTLVQPIKTRNDRKIIDRDVKHQIKQSLPIILTLHEGEQFVQIQSDTCDSLFHFAPI